MILCFSGTGNSRYIAKKIADELQDEIVDMNAKIKATDYSPMKLMRGVFHKLYRSGFVKRNCFLQNAFGS